jgi:hypothetical protein
MHRRLLIALTAVVAGLLAPSVSAVAQPVYTPGVPGAGDPYFPDMGNGGYDVGHYDIRLSRRRRTGPGRWPTPAGTTSSMLWCTTAAR